MISNYLRKKALFKKASTTYYYSSIFLIVQSKKTCLHCTRMYVMQMISLIVFLQKKKAFNQLKEDTKRAFNGQKTGKFIIDDFAELAQRKQFDPEWTWSFLKAMESDLTIKSYQSYEDVKKYIYGSADVIGLYMCKIFGTSEKAFPYAQAQGEAMQFINFIRDIQEDLALGRQYIPTLDLKKFNTHIPPQEHEIDNFKKLVRYEIARYYTIQARAERGYPYLKRSLRIPVKTASSIYMWTAKVIEKDPMIIFDKKVKPSKWRVFLMIIWHSLTA